MTMLTSFVGEVEDAIASGDPTRRVDALRRMTNLFVEQAPHLKEMHVSVFDEVILRLARGIEFRARIELSERMADIGNAPRGVVRDLALDADINVAGPVLERSNRLQDDDLVEVARAKGQDHLLALSRRATLSERVTDILVDRGDQVVVRSVAGNEGARFSDRGFTQLMDRAREDESLQTVLRTRQDIPPQHMARLVEIAREKVRETLREEISSADLTALDEAIDGVANALAASSGKALVDGFEGAMAAIGERARSGQICEDDIADWFKEGNVEKALAGLAHLAGVPIEMVARAYHSSHYDPMLFIVRSLRFGWGTFKTILTSKAGRQPPQDLLKSAFDAFQQLSVQTAQRVVRFTAVRERAMRTNAA